MSGLFGGGGSAPQTVAKTITSSPSPTPSPTPEAAPDASMGAAMGQSRAPVTRASTMLSTRRRAGDDVAVGTKRLLGQ
jgi:hypothetical protein